MEFLSWLIPAVTLLGAGFVFGFTVAEEMGPSYKWRWKHNCHHGDADVDGVVGNGKGIRGAFADSPADALAECLADALEALP